MRVIKQKIADYLSHKEEWIFVTLILIYAQADTKTGQWIEYLTLLGRFLLELSPLLLFKFFQPTLKLKLSKTTSIALWGLVFILYPFFMTIIDLETPGTPYFLATATDIYLLCFLVETVLLFNFSLSNIERLKATAEKLGLDGIIVLLLFAVSIYLGLLATSVTDFFQHQDKLDQSIDFWVVMYNLPTFISLTLQIFCLCLSGFVFYWINSHILIKTVLARRGALIYGFALVLTATLLYPLLTELYRLLPMMPKPTTAVFESQNSAIAIVVMLISLPFILLTQWNKDKSRVTELQQQKTQSELDLLKQQINPHFFFNTLNNLYALCLKNSDQAPKVVLQLSQLMHYVVYEGQQDNVAIKHEVAYIKDYIALQSIRLRKSLTMTFDVELEDDDLPIAPLLLVILVENAFKHGVELATSDCELQLSLTVKDQLLMFICQNSIEDCEATNTPSGIGLENLQRRLSLLYPNKHQLELTPQTHQFIARLTLDLTQKAD
jgi:hypothetical protein